MKKKTKKLREASDTPEDLITQVEAAELRGCSLQTVNNWVRRGHLIGYERFGKVLVSRAAVLDYKPMKPGPKPQEEAEKSVAKKRIRKKDPTRLLKTLS
jgi:excisionase family DNA binding protein